MRLPHLIWDMGGIVYTYFTQVTVEIGEREGWPIDGLALGPTGSVPDPDYELMLEGGLEEPEYARVVSDRLHGAGIGFDPRFDIDWENRARPATIAMLADLKRAGHRQAILTNDASRWLGPGWWATWPYAGYFDVMVDVATIGVRKPAPEPYLAVAQALEVPAGECLFIDDMPVNVRGAEAVGMEGFRFEVTDPEGSIETLRGRLGVGG
jgi:HAD superfamily hydrolase (TIGR01509 family)